MTFREWLDNRHNGKRYNGRIKSTAQAMGVSTVRIWHWAKFRVPAERVHKLSEITGLTPHELRPDLFREAA